MSGWALPEVLRGSLLAPREDSQGPPSLLAQCSGPVAAEASSFSISVQLGGAELRAQRLVSHQLGVVDLNGEDSGGTACQRATPKGSVSNERAWAEV